MLKSCEGRNKSDKIEYPVMLKGRISGLVVLFWKERCGVTVKVGLSDSTFIGEYYDEWDMSNFPTKVRSITITDEYCDEWAMENLDTK